MTWSAPIDLTSSILLVLHTPVTCAPNDLAICTAKLPTPPAAPTGLAATPGTGTVSLDWNDNGEGDLAGYTVYRGTSSGGPYSSLNGTLLTASQFTDTGLTAGIPDEGALQLTKDAAFPRRMGQPHEFATMAIAIYECPMMNGSTIRVDAGQRFAPR